MKYLGVAFVLCCGWRAQAVSLRSRNVTANAGTQLERTGLLCRDPATGKGFLDDVDVVLEKDGRRSLVFSRIVKDSKGKVMGREVAGVQSTVHCANAGSEQCLPSSSEKSPPTCAELEKVGKCGCEAVVSEPLKIPYQQQMASETLKLCEAKAKAKQPLRVLMFGLGGGAVPMYIRHNCETALIESVEPDARVALIAQRLLGFKADSNNRVEIADGEEAAQRHVATHPWPKVPHYDVVLVDCFDGDNRVADSCRSDRFLHAVHALLTADGQVLHNVMENDMKQILPMYHATFGVAWTSKRAVQNGQYLIVAQTHSKHPRRA